MSSVDAESANPEVDTFLEASLDHATLWSATELTSVDHDPNATVKIAELRPALVAPGAQPLIKALERTFEGVFFPALLLCSGWWDLGGATALADEIQWPHDLQYWLFSGFEKWGPSWDVNPKEIKQEQYLFGQMGEGDEAESLTVIIAGSKAQDLCAKIAQGERTFSIRATGTMCHRDHVRDVGGLRRQIRQWGKSFDYCLIVYDDEAAHKVVLVKDPPRLYSGYIWQCVLPESLARYTDGALQSPNLQDAFFLWEHTNLARTAAVDYNVESLLRKREYVAREFGKVITLQKSVHFIEGECALPRERFYDFVRGVAPRSVGGGA